MAVLNGIHDLFDSLISALNAAHIDEDKISFDFVKSRCHQEEQSYAQRGHDS